MARELYLEDSYKKECDAKIISIDGDKVVLDQTIFYPTGGGQENDLGIISQNGHTYEVYNVKKEAGEIFHYIKEPAGLTEGEVQAGLNWERRYNLMKHHSLLHVLAAVFNRKYGSLCTGNQIHEQSARIDLTEISGLSSEELEDTVREAIEEIKANHPITSRVLPREEAEQISGAIKTVVNLIPASVKEVRLVKIGNIDEQACGGTHVKETGEIGGIVLDKTKSKGKGVTRLEVRAAII